MPLRETTSASIIPRETLLKAGLNLYNNISSAYEDADGLLGPDEYPAWTEARFFYQTYPVYRFLTGIGILSYPRNRIIQGQAYWILANLFLFDHFHAARYLESARRAASWILRTQHSDGSWTFTQPGWEDRVSAVHGTWGALSLLKLYHLTEEEDYLHASLKWKGFLIDKIGTTQIIRNARQLEVLRNDRGTSADLVPNRETLVVSFLSNLIEMLSTRERSLIDDLIEFVSSFQQSNGELAYSARRHHYRCMSYGGFELVDLFELSRNYDSALSNIILHNIAEFLAANITDRGEVMHDCHQNSPQIVYQTLIVCSALHYAWLRFGDEKYRKARERILSRLMQQSAAVSRGEFGWNRYSVFVVPDKAFFARQTVYSLVCLLRIAIVGDIESLGRTLV